MPSAEPKAPRLRLRKRLALSGLCALQLTCGGCWEEIHYVPKPQGVQSADETTEQPAEEPDATRVAEAPADADPLVKEADTSPPPEAAELFSPAGPAEVAVEAPAGSDDAPAEATPTDGSILPTPEGLAADLEQASLGAGAGGETPRLAATAEDRRLVWDAASKWSLAAAIYAKGLEASRYQSILDEAVAAAAKLEIELPPLPTTGEAAELEASVIEGLRGESAVALTNALAQRFGPAEAALADLAIRSHLLLLTYSPRSGDGILQAEALRRSAEASGLTADAWTPLVTLLDERAPFVEVRQAVFEQGKRIETQVASTLGDTP